MKEKAQQLLDWYRHLPEKKKHVEFITAVLSVPVMLTVIIINLNNLNQQKNNAAKSGPTEKPQPIQIVISGEKNGSAIDSSQKTPVTTAPTDSTPTPLPTAACVSQVGDVTILSPRENEVVTSDPVCLTVATQSTYCPVVWSYKLDGGNWSDYTSKNICLHNLTNGTKIIQMKIKSTSSSDEVTLQRSFIYQGNSEPTTAPQNSTASASL